MKKIRLLLLLVIPILLALILINASVKPVARNTTTNQQMITTQEAVLVANEPLAQVTFTNSGFEPNKITLRVLTVGRVVFLNTSNQVVDVESDDHPLHTKFPLLNLGQIQPNNPDSRKLIEFTEAGVYTFHNHLNPSQKGTIEVIKQE